MKNRFKSFQGYFRAYQKRFGLNEYRIYFKQEPLDNRFAQIRISREHMDALVELNSGVDKESAPFEDIKGSAKHEAIHLLLGRYSNLAHSRYAMEEFLIEAEEELVRRLEVLIPNIQLPKGK